MSDDLDIEFVRRALDAFRIACGDDAADDADRVTLALAEQGLDAMATRILQLEAEIAVLRGTLSRYDEPDDQPIIVHDCPPDAPR
jgi:hypothetical protein